ncbi:MAG: Uma2 family endonuclease [Chloroflexota bacterium]
MTLKINRIARYYDSHEIEGEELTQSFAHYAAIQELIAVLEWLFDGETVGIVSNVNVYQTDHEKEKPKSPDIAVVKGLVLEERTSEDNPSYWIGEDGPPPFVAFEVASKETWQNDLEIKPEIYLKIGIREYFTFDPNDPSVWTGNWREENRLVGWQLDPISSGKYRKLKKDGAGRLWSEQLQSWLIVEGQYLRLYTRDGQRRLTGLEAQTQQAVLEHARAETQAQQATIERAKAEAAEQQAALERAKVEKLLELLRQKGINPNDLI